SADYWSDTKIMTYVPDASGIGAFSAGQLYLKTAGGREGDLVPFQFNPTLDFDQILPTGDDMQIDPTDLSANGGAYMHWGIDDLIWHSSDDIFYPTTVLKNGWVVDSALVFVEHRTGCSSNAYAAESRAGTSSLYLKVHWWTDPFTCVQ